MIRPPATLTPAPHIEAALKAGMEFRMLQQADELVLFVQWLEHTCGPLRTVLEIGSAQGGSTAFFCHLATEAVVSVDLPEGSSGGLPVTQAYQRNVALTTRYPHFRGILGDSHDLETLIEVRSVLDGRLVDLLFIDGDHSATGVASDVAMYGPMVRPGGVMAFHDIARRRDPSCDGVTTFWESIAMPKHAFSVDPTWGGIGAVQCR